MTANQSSNWARRRRWLAAVSLTAITTIFASLIVRGPTFILWNASPSVPIGLYVVQPNASLHVGDLAVARLPPDTQRLAAERRYLPHDVLLIKPVAAIGGSEICRHGAEIYVQGVHIADARLEDRLHRPMPEWQGCRVLTSSEIFVMNPAVADSFDGRYFGPIARVLVKGRAFPLLTFARRPSA